MYGLLELPASRPVAVQPACREAATDWNDGSENAAALHVDVNRADCCFTAPVTFALGAVGTDGPWPPDAGATLIKVPSPISTLLLACMQLLVTLHSHYTLYRSSRWSPIALTAFALVLQGPALEIPRMNGSCA